MAKPPTIVDLRWTQGLVFEATSAGVRLTIDGDSREGPSPVQALVASLVSCMAADVVYMLKKGRHPLRGLSAHLVADRAQDNPHRVVRAAAHFTIQGDVPNDAVERAITLSREKYCSVWHSLRQDIEFTTQFTVEP